MDPKIFYGKKEHVTVLVPDLDSEEDFDSDDSLLDETYKPTLLDYDEEDLLESSSGEESNADNQGNNNEERNNLGSWNEDDEIPLRQLRDKILRVSAVSVQGGVKNMKIKKAPLKWQSSNKEPSDLPTWKAQLPSQTSVETPLHYFYKLVDKELLEYIVEQTNLYAAQKDIGLNFCMDSKELEQFIGVCFYMSLITVPGTRRYWSSACRVSQVADVMPLRRWEQIKKFLHFADNSTLPVEPPDRLFKIRKLVESIRKNLRLIPMEQHLSVDEQIIPFKGRSSLKQYNPKKPKKWGYKIFCLAGASGIVYDFEFYCGATNQPENLPDISASSNIVIRLAENIPKHQNFLLFFDNWFCSPELQIELARNGIYSVGTIRENRVPSSGLPTDKSLKKQGRGSFEERITSCGSTKLKIVKWQDNKVVTLLSTFIGGYPVTTIKRFDRKNRQDVNIQCPSIILIYNKFMGGVDLIDSLLALYRTKIRSRKYYLRIFFHLMDMCVVISWLLYRRASDDCGVSKKHQMSLYDFKSDLAQSLCWVGKQNKRGRPSSSSQLPPVKKQKISSVRPNIDCRTDGMSHWPTYEQKTGRCKNGRCQKITKVMCTKCKCYLCFVPDRNCFTHFHT
ncbi:unnamed protein product [Acanthoscelides obtectus]|uniref:PiggyBac transposable element-derived protein domain-containing protein n=2 Tax=Acanthoscelides obtectus TaxID=200917 RepID=A0A9P0LSY0_ACAOB|nr:unnamed protein product [Acanthoscelides obtectus]CAK1668428.1 PiggyBac transposable element-derived protein 3 [Acanthoscelides obtectus]